MTALQITRGDDFSTVATFADEAGAINLTGFTVTASIIWATGSQAVTVTDVDRSIGKMQLSLNETQTATIPAGLVSQLKISYTSAGGITTSARTPVEGV